MLMEDILSREQRQRKYDLIFVNIPDPSTAFLNRFYTLQFFQEGNNILKKDGVLAIGVSSAVNYLGDEVGNYTGSFIKPCIAYFLT